MMQRRFPMMMFGAALVCAAPALALQAESPQVDLESVDALLGGDEVAGERPAPDPPAEPEAEGAPPPTEAAEPTPTDPAPPPPEREPSDLDRAYAAYSGCTSDAGRRLTGEGEALEVVGVRALAACGEERAAYVNAFYFALLPQAGDMEESELRIRAGRLVSQTDTFLIASATESATAARDGPGEPAPEAGAPSE